MLDDLEQSIDLFLLNGHKPSVHAHNHISVYFYGPSSK